MYMTNAGMAQNNFILPAPPVRGLPISQDWLDRMKIVRDCTIPIILSCRKITLDDYMFKIGIRYTNLDTTRGNSRKDLEAESAFLLPLMPIWLVTQPNTIISLFSKFKDTQSKEFPSSYIVKAGDMKVSL